jgi:hypothetical protein
VTDAPEAHRQAREALARLIDPAVFDPEHRRLMMGGVAPGREEIALEAADQVLSAGYVTPEAHAAALREAWEARKLLQLTAAILEAEMGRRGGEPFSGTWHFPTLDIRSTVPEAIDKAAAFLALTPPAPKGNDR